MGYTVIWSLINRDRMPAADPRVPYLQRLWDTRRLFPVIALIAGVIGSIYAGFASPTEAAVVGVVLALFLAWSTGTLSRSAFVGALRGASRTSAMIVLILAGASVLTVAMGYTGIPRALAQFIAEQQYSPYALLAALTVFFVVLGCFLDGISIVVLTASIILPMIEAAGLDIIWFGIYLVIVVEMSQITPPVGFNLFVIQGMTGHNILKVAADDLAVLLPDDCCCGADYRIPATGFVAA